VIKNKGLVGKLVIIDPEEVSETNFTRLFSRVNNGTSVLQIRELPVNTESNDVVFYLINGKEDGEFERLTEMREKTGCKIYLIKAGKTCRKCLPYLSFPFDGLFSITFLEENTHLILETIYSNLPVLEPSLHKNLAFEIDQKKSRKTPIKKFLLKRELAGSLLKENELNVLQLLLEGKTTNEIAVELYFSPSTVSATISGILKKMQVNDRTQATVQAIRNRWVESLR
jgi:two-component system, NarL family, response regulator DegU